MLLADNDHRITAPRVKLNGSSLHLEVFNMCVVVYVTRLFFSNYFYVSVTFRLLDYAMIRIAHITVIVKIKAVLT